MDNKRVDELTFKVDMMEEKDEHDHDVRYDEDQTETTEYEFENSDSDDDGAIYELVEDDSGISIAKRLGAVVSPCMSIMSHELNSNITLNENGNIVVEDKSPPQLYNSTNPEVQSINTGDSSHDLDLVWKHVDEVMENVISVNAATVTDQELIDYSNRKRRRSKSLKDPLSLPFAYAGQNFNEQSQKLILNVMHFLKLHRHDNYLEERIRTPQERAARLLNVSASVIRKLRNNWKKGILEQPAKKRNMKKRILDSVSETDENAIRNFVHEMRSAGESPSIPSLLTAARERLNFVGSRTSFRRILNRMGFKYAKVEKKLMLIDSSSGIQSSNTISEANRVSIKSKAKKNGKTLPKRVQRRVNTKTTEIQPSGIMEVTLEQSHNLIEEDNMPMNVHCAAQGLESMSSVVDMPALVPVQSNTNTTLLTNMDSFLIEPDSSILPGEYVFEFDGENLCFRLVTPEDLIIQTEDCET